MSDKDPVEPPIRRQPRVSQRTIDYFDNLKAQNKKCSYMELQSEAIKSVGTKIINKDIGFNYLSASRADLRKTLLFDNGAYFFIKYLSQTSGHSENVVMYSIFESLHSKRIT